MNPHKQHKLNVRGIPAVIEDCPYCDGSGKRMRPDDPHTPAPAATFSEEECEYLEELILDNIEQYPDSGSFTPEKRDALYQKIAFKVQAGDQHE